MTTVKVIFGDTEPMELASCDLSKLRFLAKEISNVLAKRKELARRAHVPAEKVSEND